MNRSKLIPVALGGICAGLVTVTGGAAAAFTGKAPSVNGANDDLILAQVIGPSVGGTVAPPSPPTSNTGPGLDNPGWSSTRTEVQVPEEVAAVTPTEALIAQLDRTSDLCGSVDSIYRVDCLAKQLSALAKSIPEGDEYAEAKEVLTDVSKQLNDLSRTNRDNSKPRVKAYIPSAGEEATTGALSAIKPETMAEANAKATELLDSAATVLLRSAENSNTEALYYQRISSAMNSYKVLLRS